MNQFSPLLKPLSVGTVKLEPSLFMQRQNLNLTYMLSLSNQNLLRPYLLEAGLWSYSGSVGSAQSDTETNGPETWHWGWESITCELRGHILGHWLSAAAHLIAQTQHEELGAKANTIITALARCQEANGGRWCGSFSEKYLYRTAAGQASWAPQYVIHKLLFGLYEIYTLTGNETAFRILDNFSSWFADWTEAMSQEDLDNLLDHETGGMLEVWASLYALTLEEKYLALLKRYYRHRFFDALLEGKDVLTNKHANTQIPEILGAARAYEATGEPRYRHIVEAFWKLAVEERGTYCTGGSTCGEVWTPPLSFSAHLHAPHEHCTVYNMMRLASVLYRWTAKKHFADFWERNLLNAILAQQNADTGMISYFLPLGGEAKKKWGSETDDFWCCHGTLMQAHSSYPDSLLFETTDNALVISQYLPFSAEFKGVSLKLRPDIINGLNLGQRFSPEGSRSIQVLDIPIPHRRPKAYIYQLTLTGKADFELHLRIPDWLAAEPELELNGESIAYQISEGYLCIKRNWNNDSLRLIFPKMLTVSALPDAPEIVAFIDGPLVLAGIVNQEQTLIGDINNPSSLLQEDQERHHGWWQTSTYRTKNQLQNFRFIPLYEVRDETYCVYFPIYNSG